MASVLEENKKMQTLVNGLQACLTQERHHREDLEVKVLVLEKEHQQLEAESQLLTERLSRSADQQKMYDLGSCSVDAQHCKASAHGVWP
jgi:phage shock protein A